MPLLIYGLLTPLLGTITDKILNFEWINTKINFMTIAILVAGVCLITRSGYYVVLKPYLIDGPFYFIIRETLYNLTFYIAGIFVYKSTHFYGLFHRLNFISLLLGLFLVATSEAIGDSLGNTLQRALDIFSYAFLAMVLANILFTVTAKIFSSGNSFIKFLSEASYTVYIFHYIAIYTFATLLAIYISNLYILFAIVTTLTLTVTALIHRFIISNSRVLKFFFNGKIR
jgi:glucan biosynthesis protein C